MFNFGSAKELTEELMEEVIERAVETARFYQSLGFDMITIHAAYRSP